LQEQSQYIQAIEEYMRNYTKAGIEVTAAVPPPRTPKCLLGGMPCIFCPAEHGSHAAKQVYTYFTENP
jgi:hypothetical protein